MSKLILSRKGFDSDSGYGYSPYDPESGKYIVIPIPEDMIAGTRIQYKDLKLKRDHLGKITARDLHELVHSKDLTFSQKSKNAVNRRYAHFDPMLGPCPWLDGAPAIGVFGQSEVAAGHLRRNEVKEGSLFLFYSRFKPIPGRIHALNPIVGWNKGVYYIYGWLKVGKVITNSNFSELPPEVVLANHPHSTVSDFQNRKNNTLYLAAEKLFDDLDIPGCGYLPRLTYRQLLSSELHKNIPSIWKVPAFFYEEANRPTYLNKAEQLEKRWLIHDESSYFVQATGRGQEYISSLNDKSILWVKSLFKDGAAKM